MSCPPESSPPPDLAELYGIFADNADQPATTIVPAEAVPQPYHGLLVHHHHMTVTVETYYREPVNVQVLTDQEVDNVYARKILLVTQWTQQVVQFGLVRIHLTCCSEPVRQAILARQQPLGRILIEHNVLREIEPIAFLRVELSPHLAEWFAVPLGSISYGRLGVIYTNNHPAIEVLEILAPIVGG